MIKAYAAFEVDLKFNPMNTLIILDVEIAIEHCGICHSDLSMLHNE